MSRSIGSTNIVCALCFRSSTMFIIDKHWPKQKGWKLETSSKNVILHYVLPMININIVSQNGVLACYWCNCMYIFYLNKIYPLNMIKVYCSF